MTRTISADEPAAYSIGEFCEAHRISKAQYYVLKARGLAPDECRLIGRVIITKEAAARWRKKHTAPAQVREPVEASSNA
jgi:hypothetical protein